MDEIKQYRKQRRKMIIPKIIGKFKMLTSKNINILQAREGQKNWQHDYYDHIIRDQQSLDRISDYIKNNPLNWNEDKFYENEDKRMDNIHKEKQRKESQSSKSQEKGNQRKENS